MKSNQSRSINQSTTNQPTEGSGSGEIWAAGKRTLPLPHPPGSPGSLNTLPRLRSLLQTKMAAVRGGFSRNLVTAQEIRTFQEQGVVCLRRVFGEWVDKLKKGIATNHTNPSEFSEWLKSEDSQTFYFNDFFNWRNIPEFKEFVLESPAAEIAGQLMESEVYN